MTYEELDVNIIEGGFNITQFISNQSQIEELPSIHINIIGLILSGVDFSGQDLSNRNLSRIDFSGADLSNANLAGSNLSESLFDNTDFSDANLTGADLSNAIFSSSQKEQLMEQISPMLTYPEYLVL